MQAGQKVPTDAETLILKGIHRVEVMRLYLNRQSGRKQLQSVRLKALSEQRAVAKAAPRQRQTRLDPVAVSDLIDGYHAGARIKELARRFGVHRNTVTDLLRRHGVDVRRVGLTPEEVTDGGRLYRQGWSLAKLGDRFGVDDMTVRRYLLLAGVTMRAAHE